MTVPRRGCDHPQLIFGCGGRIQYAFMASDFFCRGRMPAECVGDRVAFGIDASPGSSLEIIHRGGNGWRNRDVGRIRGADDPDQAGITGSESIGIGDGDRDRMLSETQCRSAAAAQPSGVPILEQSPLRCRSATTTSVDPQGLLDRRLRRAVLGRCPG